MRRKRRLVLGGILLSAIVSAAAVEPTHFVRGFFRGDAYFRMLPTSYWREKLRADGQAGTVSPATKFTFQARPGAVPVLSQCLHDPDPNVRWPAAVLLERCGTAEEAVPLLRRVLHDDVFAVRFYAVRSLAIRGPIALAASNDLAGLMHDDPDEQVRWLADAALWEVNPLAARRAGNWRTFRSSDWRFSAMFPAEPEHETRTVESPQGPVIVHLWKSFHRATACQVFISEYPADFVAATTEEQRTDAMRSTVGLFFPNGELTEDKPIEIAGRRGRESRIEVKDMGILRARRFWVGPNLYSVHVAFQPRFLIPPATEFFLDSFQIDQ